MVWLNVDRPEKDCCIHADPNCREVLLHSGGTALKGSREILDDGGWMEFQTIVDAQAYAAANWPRFRTHPHRC